MSSRRTDQKKVETYAQVLLDAAKAEGHEGRVLEQLELILEMPKELMEMLGVMFEQKDIDKLPQLVDLYGDLLEKGGNTIPIEVTTAIELDDELRDKIRTKFEADLGRPVFLVERVDPSIMGGIIVSTRTERRDASVRTQLQNMRTTLGDALSNGGDAE